MTNQEKAHKLESAAIRLKSAASAYRHGRMVTGRSCVAGALTQLFDIAKEEG